MPFNPTTVIRTTTLLAVTAFALSACIIIVDEDDDDDYDRDEARYEQAVPADSNA